MLLIVGSRNFNLLPTVWGGACCTFAARWAVRVCARFCICTTLFQFYSPFSSFAWYISWGRDAAVTFARQLTRLHFPFTLGCPPHYPLYISNYTLILNLKHLQTDAWVWRSLRFSVTIFHFPCHEAAKMLGHKRNRPDFPVTAKET